jgi:hypothetical protein
MTSEPKLSRLQKFILLEAAKTLPEVQEIVRRENGLRQGAIEIGWLRADSEPIKADNVAHISRQKVLKSYFNLSYRKRRFQGWVTDQDTDRIDATIEPIRYNRANATLYRAIRRLEARGLINRMNRFRAGLQLNEKGVVIAAELSRLD